MEVTTKIVKWTRQPPFYSMWSRKIVSTTKGIYSIDCDAETVKEDSHLFRVYIWDQNDFTWKRILYPENQDKTQIAPSLIGFSAVAHGQFIYNWGGYHNGDNIIGPKDPSLYQFNTDTNIWTKPKQKGNIPVNRENHGAVVVDGRMIIFGGAQVGDYESLEMYSLDLDTFNWTFFGEFEPSELYLRSVKTSFVFKDRFIYFFSEYDEDHYFDENFLEKNLACFDLQEKKFVLTKLDQDNEATPNGRFLKGGFSHGCFLYFFDFDCRIYMFNPGNGVWKKQDFYWKGFGLKNDVVVTKDQIIVFLRDSIGEHIDDDEDDVDIDDVEFVHIFNLKCNLQSMCIMRALAQNSDISSLPNKIKKEINNFKWIKTY